MMVIKAYQPRIYAFFQKIVSDKKLSHAYLFAGDFSTFEMAIALGKAIFCQSLENGEACGGGACRTCRLIQEDAFPDLKIIEPTGTVIKTDTIREMVGEFSQSGFEGLSQVFIIKESEKLHPNAANSLLKMIEEPTSDSYIFLLTSDESKILPTIKSRCQVVQFPSNKAFIVEKLEAEGMLKSQANLVADLVKTIADIPLLAKSTRLLTILNTCQSLMASWLKGSEQAYFEVVRLSSLVTEKAEQEQVFTLLIGLLAQEKPSLALSAYLDGVTKARQMWQANVSLQNSLDYMLLSVENQVARRY